MVYDSPINEIGLEFVGLKYSVQETRNLKLEILGIQKLILTFVKNNFYICKRKKNFLIYSNIINNENNN